MKFKFLVFVIFFTKYIFFFFPVYLESSELNLKKKRNLNWAKKINADTLGLPNFYKVSENLYRGAQPTESGIKKLKKFGIKTIVNLRSFHSDKDEINKTKINYIHLFVKAWHIEEKEVIKFLNIVSDTSMTPVFIHCQHGADRTGTMCAIYRIVIQGWSKEAAIEEMIYGEYKYHSIWKNLISFIKKLDVNKLKTKLKNSG